MTINNKYEILLDSLKSIEKQTDILQNNSILNMDNNDILIQNNDLKAQVEFYKNQLEELKKALKLALVKLQELEKIIE
jgi:hypothetical protein